MKIGLVLSDVPSYSETFFRNKIKFLQESGFEIKLFVENRQTEFNLCPVVVGYTNLGTNTQTLVKLLILLSRCIRNPVKISQLWRLNKRDGFAFKENVLSLMGAAHILGHSLDWLHFGFATMAINRENIAQVIGAKMAVSIRGFDVCIYPLKHRNCYQLMWKRIDKLHYISDDLLKVALELGFDNKTQKMKITPAIDTDLFSKTELKYKKSSNGKISIITIARLHWKKGLDYTLEALKIIKDAGILFEYQIIGDGLEYERLIFESHQLGLQNEVVFLGKLEPKEIKQKLALVDIYLQYSLQEGFCNAVLEAQAMGCLCVVSNAEGLNENVLDGITGFVVEKRNPILLAQSILNVLSMPIEDKKRISTQAMERVSKKFKLELQRQQFIDFY